MISASFIDISKRQSYVFDYWSGGYYASRFAIFELVWLSGGFSVNSSDELSDLKEKEVGVRR